MAVGLYCQVLDKLATVTLGESLDRRLSDDVVRVRLRELLVELALATTRVAAAV
jgi:hypothetical protein